MVCEWGMSEAMGPLTFGKKEEQIFLGREIAQHQDYSEDTALRIDQEVKKFVTDNYARAQNVLLEHKQKLLDMADALLARETLDADQVRRIAAGEPLDAATWREASILTVGRLIARAALRREESRGGHFRADFPKRDDIHWKRRASEIREGGV
jgi:succinate dehydrogenase/fumarate reductase flavoprotein subunit